ncbi:Asp/Glu racemase [Salipiger aestuarii]|nr:Asp/Glu racemase [Salipiger aestuarii]KAB2542031.1 Asp/Glu racemase [Salipiger aestuarii]
MNPNSSAATTRAMLAIARRILPELMGWTAPEGPEMITDADALARAAVRVGGADLPPVAGIIVSAFGDPGRAALAARLTCPVVGIGAEAARAAGQGGRRFAVVTTTPGLRAGIDALMGEAGDYMGCYITPGDPRALMGDARALDAALLAQIRRAAAAGAKAAIIGGGPLGEAADRLADRSPIALVAPIPTAAAALKARLNLR